MISFPIKISNQDGEWGITCEKLGIIGQHDSMEMAMESFQAAIDLMADTYEPDDRQAKFDIEASTFSFSNTVALLPFIFNQLRRRSGKSFTDIQKELGLASVGAVHKYFNEKNKTAPNIQKFLELTKALNVEVTLK